jgi:hypothetical protein
MYRKLITYDRKTGDFAMYLNGELVGYAATYLQAESALNNLVYELLSRPSVPAPAAPTAEQTDYAASAT